MVRAATEDDTALISGLLTAPLIRPIDADPESVRTVLQLENQVVWVDEAGAVCRIERNTYNRDLSVVWLFPRGPDRVSLIKPLAGAILDCKDRWPDYGPRWIWAGFFDLPEGGPGDSPAAQTNYNLCKAWKLNFPQAVVAKDARGRYTIGSTLDQAVAVARLVPLGA